MVNEVVLCRTQNQIMPWVHPGVVHPSCNFMMDNICTVTARGLSRMFLAGQEEGAVTSLSEQ